MQISMYNLVQLYFILIFFKCPILFSQEIAAKHMTLIDFNYVTFRRCTKINIQTEQTCSIYTNLDKGHVKQ